MGINFSGNYRQVAAVDRFLYTVWFVSMGINFSGHYRQVAAIGRFLYTWFVSMGINSSGHYTQVAAIYRFLYTWFVFKGINFSGHYMQVTAVDSWQLTKTDLIFYFNSVALFTKCTCMLEKPKYMPVHLQLQVYIFLGKSVILYWNIYR